MNKLKDYIHSTLITQGYDISYVDFEEHHLDKIIELAQEAKGKIGNKEMYYKLEGLYEDFRNVMKSGNITESTKSIVAWDIYSEVVDITGLEYRFTDDNAEVFLEEFGSYLEELSDD